MKPSKRVDKRPIALNVGVAVLISLLALVGPLSAIPPLSLDGFRDEALPDSPEQPQANLRANQSCYVCHENMREDILVLDHAKQNIGCMRCHGESVDHRNDEDNITPPDKMFTAEKIDPMCFACHEHHDVPGLKVVKRLHERKLIKKEPREILCVSCHYDHKLAIRTVRWNKDTGELIMYKGKAGSVKAREP